MQAFGSPTSGRMGTTCGALLRELQHIWSEIGESEADKDRMLLELERECLEVYRRKVDEASNSKARLHQSLAAKEAEFAALMAALGELSLHSQRKSKNAEDTKLGEHIVWSKKMERQLGHVRVDATRPAAGLVFFTITKRQGQLDVWHVPAHAPADVPCLSLQTICSAKLTEKRSTSLKEQLASVAPLVEDLRTKKEERIKQFADIKTKIERVTGEISGYNHLNDSMVSCLNMEEQDLSLRKLTEYQAYLRALQKEKSDRLHKVLEYVNEVHSLCGVLGLDFGKTVSEVHPSLHETDSDQFTNISNNTLEGLNRSIMKLKAERKARIQKLKDIVASLFELWNLMDSPKEERSRFGKITFIIGLSEQKITEAGVLSQEIIDQAAVEVDRLTKLKASRMKELVMKKRSELEEICRRAHIEPDMSTSVEKSNALIDSGLVDPSELLANIESQINKAKDEAAGRKEIMDRIDRWLSACEEESWLEDYNQDENRYSAGRGAHINLKRAERARVTVNKIPAMVDNLISKALAWEDYKKMPFLYDGVQLLSILEDYKLTRLQREDEKKRFRDQKKLQDLLLTEKEAMYGSKPSPKRNNSFRKPNGYRANGNGSMTPTPRRVSVGSATSELLTPRSYSGRQNGYFKETRRLSMAPLNFVAIPKEDTTSYASICGSEPGTPRG